MSEKIRVLWHWPVMGPYHFARMDAIRAHLDIGLTVVESALQDDHEWIREKPYGIALSDAKSTPQGYRITRDAYAAALREVRPDVVVEFGYFEPYSREVSFRYRRDCPDSRLLLWSDSTAFDHPRSPWREWAKSAMLAAFDGALVAGKPHKKYLEELGMAPASVCNVGGGCVDNDFFERACERLRCDARSAALGGPASPYFLYVGRLVPQKNLPVLLQAYRYYRTLAGSRAWELVIVGGGPDELRLRQVVDSQGIGGVTFAGLTQPDKLPSFYAGAGCFVLPSTSEPWGLVVNEAMAASLPVLLSANCGCASDLLLEGVNGFSFDPKDPIQLGNLMSRITDGSTNPADMGRESLKIVKQFSLEEFANKCVGHIRAVSLAADPGSRRSRSLVVGRMISSIHEMLSTVTGRDGR